VLHRDHEGAAVDDAREVADDARVEDASTVARS
jgi:hypothetical protein